MKPLEREMVSDTSEIACLVPCVQNSTHISLTRSASNCQIRYENTISRDGFLIKSASVQGVKPDLITMSVYLLCAPSF